LNILFICGIRSIDNILLHRRHINQTMYYLIIDLWEHED